MEKTFRAERRRHRKAPLCRSTEGMEKTFHTEAPKASESPSVPKHRGRGKDLSCESRMPRACLNVLKSRRPRKKKSTSAPKRRGHGKSYYAKAEGPGQGPLYRKPFGTQFPRHMQFDQQSAPYSSKNAKKGGGASRTFNILFLQWLVAQNKKGWRFAN